eukprot:9484444-Pyramimonas_sp.AAC.1
MNSKRRPELFVCLSLVLRLHYPSLVSLLHHSDLALRLGSALLFTSCLCINIDGVWLARRLQIRPARVLQEGSSNSHRSAGGFGRLP